jgi:hypothetical protein
MENGSSQLTAQSNTAALAKLNLQIGKARNDLPEYQVSPASAS